jgi:hypothetical protein
MAREEMGLMMKAEMKLDCEAMCSSSQEVLGQAILIGYFARSRDDLRAVSLLIL